MTTILTSVEKNARFYPDRPAVADSAQTYSYAALWRKASGFARWLRHRNLKDGERIAVEAMPSVSYVVSALAVYLSGGVLVPVEQNISAEMLLQILSQTDAGLFIGQKPTEEVPFVSIETVSELAETAFMQDHVLNIPGEEDTADILYTTGTTGKSKGVMLSHKAVFASAHNSAVVDGLNGSSVYLIATPLNHTNAYRKLLSCFISGACAVLQDGFLNVGAYYRTIDKFRVNTLLLPPSAVRLLLTVSRQKLSCYANQIRVVHSGSAAMPEADKEGLKTCLPNAKLIFGYGATEAGNACAYDYAEFPGLPGCVGKANTHSRILIVDENRTERKASRTNPGRIAISGDTVMQGYLNDTVQTQKVLQNGILYTNDMGYTDENGFVFVVGRADDIINCGGLKIAPYEVENAALRYGNILDCACFGVKDDTADTVVKLNIIPDDKACFDIQDFRAFLQQNLERHQVPKQIEIVGQIPKTPNGKTDRTALK